MSKAADNRDFSKGEEITNSFLEKFSYNNAFFAALITALQDEVKVCQSLCQVMILAKAVQ